MNRPPDEPAGSNTDETAAEAYARLLRENNIAQGRASARRQFWTAIIIGVGVLVTIATIIFRSST